MDPERPQLSDYDRAVLSAIEYHMAVLEQYKQEILERSEKVVEFPHRLAAKPYSYSA